MRLNICVPHKTVKVIVIFLVLVSSNIKLTAQEEFITGAFIHSSDSSFTLYNNYQQMIDLGLNSVFQQVVRELPGQQQNLSQLGYYFPYIYAANDSGTGGGNDFDTKRPENIDWISYFTHAKYTKWEAEGSPLFTYHVQVKHEFGQEYTEGSIRGWESGAPDPSNEGKLMMTGPDYWQYPRYTYTNCGWNNTPINYKAVFRMKIDEPSETAVEVCEIYVTQSRYDAVTNTWILKDTLHLPGQPEVITLSTSDLSTEYQDFEVEYNYTGWFDEPEGQNTPPPPTLVNDPFNELSLTKPTMNEGSQVQFNVKWLGNRRLFVDYIEVYDAGYSGIWERFFKNNFVQTVNTILTYDNNFKNANPDFHSKLKYYGTIDEPHVIDCYEPVRKVQHILNSLDINADLLIHWYPGWHGRRELDGGDATFPVYKALVDPKKLMFWYAPFVNEIENNYQPKSRDFTLYYLRYNLQEAHLQQPDFYVTLQSWGTMDQYGNYQTYMLPTPEEISAETMLSLAHGVDGIYYEMYYSYCEECDNKTLGLVDYPENGIYQPRPQWYKVKELASRLKGILGKTLMSLAYSDDYLLLRRSVEPSEVNTAETVSESYLTLSTDVGESRPNTFNFHAGFFQPENDNKHCMLINMLTDTLGGRMVNIGVVDTAYVNIKVKNVETVNNFDTTLTSNLSFNYYFPAGEGYLFQVAPVVKYGGKLIFSETITSSDTLRDKLIIYSGDTLKVQSTYTILDTIVIKSGATFYLDEGAVLNLSDNGNIEVQSGGLFVIKEGAELNFYNSLPLSVKGTLNAQGVYGDSVIFTRGGSTGTWGSIKFDGSSSSGSMLKYVKVSYASDIQCLNSANVTIQNSRIQDCTEGIYIYNSEPRIIRVMRFITRFRMQYM